MDLCGNLLTTVSITHDKVHNVNILYELPIEPGAIYVMDRDHIDFERLYKIVLVSAFYVIRAKNSFGFRSLYSRPIDKWTGLQCDQTILLNGFYASKDYPDTLRHIRYFNAATDKHLVFLTNHFALPAPTITKLYQRRWQIELFFKWIKQHLCIKAFYGTSENAVKTQIWIAISVYVPVAIVKKRLKLEMAD